MAKTYVTTAIPYTNGKPHIGHIMDYLLADVYARYKKLYGDEVRFQAGTDEHGNKIHKKAQENNLSVKDYVDVNSASFQDFIHSLGVDYTDFIRTTDPNHERRCQEIWEKLKDHIYKSSYEGWYCEGCEGFITEKEYEENNGICPDHQKPYERLTEENYYLKISDFKDRITDAISSGEMKILPEFRKKEVLKLLETSPDVSISRPKKNLSWGIQVPGDDSQVMYVWMDALTNYITVLGYPENDISDWWPAGAQFVGKDILRFHAIIWPTILLGLNLPLPKVICSHGHILSNNQKMSKSIGNVVSPTAVLERYGLPALRYYFLRHIDTFMDSDFTWEKFDAAYNNELANDLGNLVQRLATLSKKNKISGCNLSFEITDTTYKNLMENFQFSKAIDYVWTKVQGLNRSIDETKPWELAKQGKTTELEKVLTKLIKELLEIANLLSPFLPEISEKITAVFSKKEIFPPEIPLFPKN